MYKTITLLKVHMFYKNGNDFLNKIIFSFDDRDPTKRSQNIFIDGNLYFAQNCHNIVNI